MKKSVFILSILVMICLSLTGCKSGQKYEFTLKKSINRMEKYVKQTNKQDFFDCYYMLQGSGVTGVRFYKQELMVGGDYDESTYDALEGFFKKHPEIDTIEIKSDNEMLFRHSKLLADLIICENTEPQNLAPVADTYKKKNSGKYIFWISDHLKDNTSHYQHMYYENGVKKVDDNLWVGDSVTGYPWYSRFVE